MQAAPFIFCAPAAVHWGASGGAHPPGPQPPFASPKVFPFNSRLWFWASPAKAGRVLAKIPRLMDAINFGPSKGLCAVIGAQALSLIDEIYGREIRESIHSAVTTHVCFSVGSKATAQEVADLIGRVEKDRKPNQLFGGSSGES